jgi:dodecin
MADHVYRVIRLVGTSPKGVEAAIENALKRAAKTLKNLRWFELMECRGDIVNGKVSHYQATIRVGFTIADKRSVLAEDG